jgi:serine/threonine-protein kinase RIO1
LLVHDRQLWVIDVGQAVDLSHPEALELLRRDCRNLLDAFRKVRGYAC